MWWRMWVSPEVGSVDSCFAVSESWARRMPRREGETRDFCTAMGLLQQRDWFDCSQVGHNRGDQLFFFSADSAANGLACAASSSATGQSRSTLSDPGDTGISGMA